jgi:DNA-binding transcriptional LysR family regulator
MDLELRLLRHALALAAERSFARAARRFGLTQPAMSRSIQELERRTGVRLFVRGRGGVEPTDAGNVLLEAAAEVVTRADDLGRQLNRLQGLDVEALTVGSGPYPAELLVGEALARTMAAHETVRFRVVVDQYPVLVQALRRRDCDLVIGERSAPAEEDLEVRELLPHQGYFVVRAGHPLLSRSRPGVAEVFEFPLTTTGRLPPRVLKPLAASLPPHLRSQLGARPLHRVESSSLALLKQVVAASDAVAFLTLSGIESELEDGRLGVVDCVEPWLHSNFAVTWPRRRGLAPSAEALVANLVAVDRERLAMDERLAARHLGRRRGGGVARRASRAAPRGA